MVCVLLLVSVGVVLGIVLCGTGCYMVGRVLGSCCGTRSTDLGVVDVSCDAGCFFP